jgi:UTP--glucose-1-phosphate uridylyltransferase
MSAHGLAQAQRKMTDGAVHPIAVDVFTRFYGLLESGATGVIPESDVDPLTDVPHAADLDVDEEVARAALAVTAVIKLNGGLGTSMGMDRAKSLLRVRGDRTFLDVIAGQVLAARAATGARGGRSSS